MKVLYLTRKYPPSVGGMQKYHGDLIAELRKTVDMDLIALTLPQRNLFWFLPYAFLKGMTSNCDIVHAGDGLMACVGWLLSKIKSKPFTVTIFGLDITYRNRLYQALVIPLIRNADRILCISGNTKKLCIERGFDRGKCITVPCGIPVAGQDDFDRDHARKVIVSKFGIDPHNLILLSVGRLVERKGIVWLLLNVFPSLNRTTLMIAGGGPDRVAIEKAAGGRERIHVLGEVDEDTLRSLYRGSDAFIMPNISVAGDAEGFGMVLLEAGSHGLYSFASRVDGIPDAIKEGTNGTLLESRDAQQWITMLKTYERKHDQLHHIGLQAREYVMNKFTQESVARGYQKIWYGLTI